MKLELAPEAEAELAAERDRYEAEREGLGQDFIAEVGRVMDRIKDGPLHFQKVPRTQARRALTERYPFALVFRIHDDRVRIIAVAPQRKRQRYWRTRS